MMKSQASEVAQTEGLDEPDYEGYIKMIADKLRPKHKAMADQVLEQKDFAIEFFKKQNYTNADMFGKKWFYDSNGNFLVYGQKAKKVEKTQNEDGETVYTKKTEQLAKHGVGVLVSGGLEIGRFGKHGWIEGHCLRMDFSGGKNRRCGDFRTLR